MKKLTAFVLALVCLTGATGCARSMNHIIENEPNITGIVKEIYDTSILISVETDGYPYGADCIVSLHAENKDSMTYFDVGDEVVEARQERSSSEGPPSTAHAVRPSIDPKNQGAEQCSAPCGTS